MATSAAAATRTVVLLRPSEKKRLLSLARAQRVSSGEIIRRSLEAYNPTAPQADDDTRLAIAEMNNALDEALKAVRSARAEVAQNIQKVQQLKAKRA